MAAEPGRGLMTADELLAMPDDDQHQYELVRGRLICMSPSSSKPAIVAGNIGGEVRSFVKEHRLGICGGADWGFKITSNPDTVRAPDFSFVRAERVPPGGIPPGFWPGAPDFAVEVLSPSNSFTEIMEKVEDYLRAGTRLVWVVDPEKRKVTVLRPGRAPMLVGEDGELDGADVLPGFTLPLREIWV